MKFPTDRPVKVVMLGAGGTGGYVAPYVFRLLHMLDRPARFVVCDGDIVEPKNLDRQNFVPADLGENKARVLAERYSTVLGMETEYVPSFIEKLPDLMELIEPKEWELNPYSTKRTKEMVLLLGCVDNNKTRQLCHQAFHQSEELIYIDSGNGKYTGQVVCGVRRNGRTIRKSIGGVHPEMLKDTDLFPSEISCAEAAQEDPQSKIPIVDTARRCGLVLDSRTLRRKEVEASCPFCGDHGPGKYHLSLNTDTDQYRCNLCGAHGNSVSLYARIKGICNKEAYLELAHESKVYPLPQPPSPQTQERQPCSLEQRHAVYSDMLAHLTLLPKHSENLLERGLSEERIRRNEYRSMPETERGRRLLADLLRSHGHDLHGIPGFRTYYGDWTLSGPNGFLIPVRNKDGLIQGLKIRLDDAQQANRKYRWLSSRNLPSGTRSYSWVHVTGNTQSKRAFLTEGPLKGDVASFLAQDALFICIGGVNALNGLNDTIRSLGVREVVEAMDMDQMTNPNVRSAILTMRKEVRKIPGIRYSKYTWNPAYKGVDDYLLSQAATM